MSLLPDCMDTVEKSEAGITFPVLRLDTGEPLVNGETPVTITVKGPDSAAYKRAYRETQNKRLKAVAAGLEFDDEQAEIELLAAVTMSWTGFHDGKSEAPCTPENAALVYKRFPVVKDQVQNRVSSRRNFIKGSSPG